MATKVSLSLMLLFVDILVLLMQLQAQKYKVEKVSLMPTKLVFPKCYSQRVKMVAFESGTHQLSQKATSIPKLMAIPLA